MSEATATPAPAPSAAPEMLRLIDVYAAIRQACREAGSQAKWAQKHGLSQSYLSEVLNAKKPPNKVVLRALGLAEVTRYVRIKPKEAAGG